MDGGGGSGSPWQEASVHVASGTGMSVSYLQHLGIGHPPLLRVMLARTHSLPRGPSLWSNFWFRVIGLGLFKVRVSVWSR
jgi:hypothetical protein